MSTFEDAIGIVLQNEGGYVNNPNDPGGETNMGITVKFLHGLSQQGKLDDDIDPDNVRALTVEQVSRLYNRFWWNAYSYGNINDQAVATKIFDLSVNMGPKRIHKIAQMAANTMGGSLTVDGGLGPTSYGVINSLDPTDYLQQIKVGAGNFYQHLVMTNPALQQFLKGWLNRAYS